MSFSVGYAQIDIAPSLERPVFLAGFGQNRRAESIHDQLTARALAIHSGERTLVLCALDLVGFFRPDVLAVVQAVRNTHPQVEVLIAATHTHHGPDTIGLWGPAIHRSGVDPVYMAWLKEKLVETISGAVSSLEPAASVRAAVTRVPGWVKNTRDPEVIDDELACLQLVSPSGRVMASLFNFPCHPEVLWEHNPHITADYPGFLRSVVEGETGAPCIFFSGALGGMLTPDVYEHSFEEAEQMGHALAAAGLRALQERSDQDDRPVVRLSRAGLRIPLTNPLFKLAFRRGLLPDVRTRRGEIATQVSLIRVGTALFAAVPGELLPRLGLSLKARLRETGSAVPGVIGLADDELGYLLPVEDFRYPWNPFKPGQHYEETMSISKHAGPKVVSAVYDLLDSFQV